MGVLLRVKGELSLPRSLEDPDDGTDVAVRFENVVGAEGGWQRVWHSHTKKYVNHSPTGFSWGYAGSGPSQLAFGILQTALGPEAALKHYQAFKFDTVALTTDQTVAFEFVVDIERWVEAVSKNNGGSTEERRSHIEYVRGF